MKINNTFPKWTIHLVIWMVYFLLAALRFLLPSAFPEFPKSLLYVNLTAPLCSLLLFYSNYLFLVEFFWIKKKYVAFISINLLSLIAALGINGLLNIWLVKEYGAYSPGFEQLFPMMMAYSYLPGGIFAIVLSSLIRISHFWNQIQDKILQMGKEKIEAELKGLKSQMNPHFLFNSLNAIYALIDSDKDEAKKATHILSNILRYVLEEREDEMVFLKDEISFTNDYILLMKMRFSNENLSLNIEMSDDCSDYKIASMLIISLVENAFKHGISNSQKSFIKMAGSIEEGYFKLNISNSNYPKTNKDRSGSGIGLDNLSRRLRLIYGDSYRMEVMVIDNTYTTILNIPLKK